MGKQTRRRRGGKNSNPGSKPKPNNSPSSQQSDSSSPTIESRIRHADSRVRYAALSALSSTIFSPQSLNAPTSQSNKKKKKDKKILEITPSLLKTVLSKINDSDPSVAKNAAGCISNYASFSSSATSAAVDLLFSSGNDAGLVIQSCLANCLQRRTEIEHQELMIVALQTLTAIIENGSEMCLEKLSRIENAAAVAATGGDGSLIDTVHKCVVLTDNNDNVRNKNARDAGARVLHSLLDDNLALAKYTVRQKGLLSEWKNVIIDNGAPSLCRLHLSGAIVNLHQLLPSVVTSTSIINDVSLLKVLVEHLQFDSASVDDIIKRVKTAKKSFDEEDADAKMERDIVRTVEEKGESARSIARRQKEEKKKAKEAMDEEEEGDEVKKKQVADIRETDAKEEYEMVLHEYKNIISTLVLALEVATNLCATGGTEDHSDTVMTDADNDAILFDAIASSNLPSLAYQLFLSFHSLSLDYFLEGENDDGKALRDKTAACLVNLYSNQGDTIPTSLWKDTQSLMSSSSVTAVQLSALRSSPSLQKLIGEPELQSLLKQCLSQNSDKDTKRDTIAMLSVLGSMPHSRAVNHVLASTLLTVLQERNSSVAIKSDVLNALMDIYSDETRHGDVFEELTVAGIMEKVGGGLMPMEEDEEETKMNVERFLDWRRGLDL